MKELADIERHINKNVHYASISNDSIKLSYNKTAWFINVASPHCFGAKSFDLMLKKLPSWIGHFSYINGKHVLALIETVEQQQAFFELKASIIGEFLFEHQQETLKIMGHFADSLKELNGFKKQHTI